jgi:hypothetical protein
MMATALRPNVVLDEMRRHREVTPLKRPVHPGRTQKEAGFTPVESRWLTIGVCRDVTCEVERGERLANRILIALAVLLLLAIGAGVLTDRWAAKQAVQTVEAGQP